MPGDNLTTFHCSAPENLTSPFIFRVLLSAQVMVFHMYPAAVLTSESIKLSSPMRQPSFLSVSPQCLGFQAKEQEILITSFIVCGGRHMGRGPRTTCGNWFSPTRWVPGMESRLSGLVTGTFTHCSGYGYHCCDETP